MFNLNIDEYSNSELEELFNLSGVHYSKEILKQSYLRSLNKKCYFGSLCLTI